MSYACQSTLVSIAAVKYLLSKVFKKIDQQFVSTVSYQYAKDLSILNMKNMTLVELMRETQQHISLESQPKQINLDSLMTPQIQTKIQQQQNPSQKATIQSFNKTGNSMRRSKTLTQNRFQRSRKSNIKSQLKQLVNDNPEEGYINGLRQLKYQQMKYKIVKPIAKKTGGKKLNPSEAVFDYDGEVMKLKSAQSTHIIRTAMHSHVAMEHKISSRSKILKSSQSDSKGITSIFRHIKQKRQQDKCYQYCSGIPLRHLKLQKGVKLVLDDGSIINNNIKQDKISFKDLKLSEDINKIQYNRLKTFRALSTQRSTQIKQEVKNIFANKSLSSTKLDKIQKVYQPKMLPKALQTLTSSQLKTPILPQMNSLKHQSLIRTRRQGKQFKHLMEQRHKKFEQKLRTIIQ